MAEEHGHYEKVGDIEEWRWAKGHEPKVDVPKGEFDPRAVTTETAPEVVPPAKPKAAAKKPAAKAKK